MKVCLRLLILCALVGALSPARILADGFAADLLYPTNGAANVDLNQPFRWTTVPAAEAYFLVIGTAPGQTDVWASGEMRQTSVMVPQTIAKDRTLYARIWTEMTGILRHSADVSFTVGVPSSNGRHVPSTLGPIPGRPTSAFPVTSVMLYPTDGAKDVDTSLPFRWSPIKNAQAYSLSLGTARALSDLFDSGEILQTSVQIPELPVGVTIYTRIGTKTAGTWHFSDASFSAAPRFAAFLYPTNKMFGVDLSRRFEWTSVAGADAYVLYVGSTPGASDLYRSGEMDQTSTRVPGLPPGATLYARLCTSVAGVRRCSDAVFTSATLPIATMAYPADGATDVDTAHPFGWTSSGVADAYRLEIGAWPGTSALLDTGTLRVDRRFTGPLPVGIPLYGRISTELAGKWYSSEFRFTVAANGDTWPQSLSTALWATDWVRGMADDGNVPFPDTPLANLLAAEGWTTAFCSDYASVLLSMLQQMNIQPARILYVYFKPNAYDSHTLVELREPGGTWMLLDPTFDLTARRAADGQWATASDISDATRTMHFSDISYEFLGKRGNSVASSYYLDYPLLYLEVCSEDGCSDPVPSSLPYMDPVSLPLKSWGVYAIQGAPGATVEALVDGTVVQFDCDSVDGLTFIFGAGSIDSTTGPSIRVFRPRRFVF